MTDDAPMGPKRLGGVGEGGPVGVGGVGGWVGGVCVLHGFERGQVPGLLCGENQVEGPTTPPFFLGRARFSGLFCGRT